MSRTLVLLTVLALIAGGAWYWWSTRPSAPPTITITAPASGEAWNTGDAHTISWTTSGIPSSNKVSITIRRIPPPPLPEEGQEFDPIIYTDLPNTGSAMWTISDMYPSGKYVLGLTAYKSTPVTNPISAESAEFTLSRQALNKDLLPLYSDAHWEVPKAEIVTMATSTYSGVSVSSLSIMPTRDPGSVFTPFERYYDNHLKALGWKVDNYLAAGGHVGGQTGYRKGSGLVLVRFSILYHTVTNTAPSECPCDVTLSLFSAN